MEENQKTDAKKIVSVIDSESKDEQISAWL